MKLVIFGLGSNKQFLNNSPLENLVAACKELQAILINPVFSSVYKTKAMYVENQEDFYNMVALGFVSDDLEPEDCLRFINKIEEKYGRNRDKEIRFGPRSLDIDIEEFGDVVINTEKLQIPHIRIKERPFVLIPLLEIFPEYADEIKKNEYLESLLELENKGETEDVKLFISKEDFSKLL